MIDESVEALTSWPSMVRVNKFHSWFVPVKLEVGIVGNLINCIFIHLLRMRKISK